jgi:hypothetical protein
MRQWRDVTINLKHKERETLHPIKYICTTALDKENMGDGVGCRNTVWEMNIKLLSIIYSSRNIQINKRKLPYSVTRNTMKFAYSNLANICQRCFLAQYETCYLKLLILTLGNSRGTAIITTLTSPKINAFSKCSVMWTYQQRRSSSASFRRFRSNPLKIIYERYHYYFQWKVIINCILKITSMTNLLTETLGEAFQR